MCHKSATASFHGKWENGETGRKLYENGFALTGKKRSLWAGKIKEETMDLSHRLLTMANALNLFFFPLSLSPPSPFSVSYSPNASKRLLPTLIHLLEENNERKV